MPGRYLVIAFLVLAACADSEKKGTKRYVDIREYFRTEANRLKKFETTVIKTVSRNGASESKQNIKPDWNTEFSLFAESDINKPAWRNSYHVRTKGSLTFYSAIDSDLRTRSIVIKKNKDGKITHLAVVNKTKNYLYSSSEILLYIPDSVYRIEKIQDVLLLGNNSYKISGTFQ